MTDKFGEGLEVDPAAGGNQPVEDDFMTTARDLMDGIDPSWTREQFADHLTEMANKANSAAALEQQLADRQALMSQIDALKPADKPEPKTETAAEAKRRWEASRISEDHKVYLREDYVEVNPRTGLLQPKELVRGSKQVNDACEAMNRHSQARERFFDELASDPYAAAEEMFNHLPYAKQMEQKFEAWKTEIEGRLKPISEITAQQDLDAFAAKHMNILTRDDGKGGKDWSLAGEAFNEALWEGMSRDGALNLAQKIAAKEQPAAKAPVLPAKPQTGLQRIQRRVQAEGTATAERGGSRFAPPQKFKETMADVRKRLAAESAE